MKIKEILKRVEFLPLSFEDADNAYLDQRWLLSKDPATIVLNKHLVRRRVSDVYNALKTDPYLMRFTNIDKEGHVRVGPFQVLYQAQPRFLYMTFAKTAPITSLFFAEACLSKQEIEVSAGAV